MSASPNNQSPPAPASVCSVNENQVMSTKVIVPLPVVQHHDEIYYYVFVKGSLYNTDCSVFGLESIEIEALSKKFLAPPKEVENGVMFKKSANIVINSLAQLGYKVSSSCGETETLWTMQREIEKIIKIKNMQKN